METVNNSSQNKITVFFDGLCVVCSKEISHYQKMRGADKIQFIDINSSAFDAAAESLDPKEVHKNLHAKDTQGRVYIGVDSFFLIWSQLDSLKNVVPVASLKPIKKSLEIGYSLFVRIRPFLPRKKCSDSPYCELRK